MSDVTLVLLKPDAEYIKSRLGGKSERYIFEEYHQPEFEKLTIKNVNGADVVNIYFMGVFKGVNTIENV